MLYLINALILTGLATWGYMLKSEGTLPAVPYIAESNVKYVWGVLIAFAIFNFWAAFSG